MPPFGFYGKCSHSQMKKQNFWFSGTRGKLYCVCEELNPHIRKQFLAARLATISVLTCHLTMANILPFNALRYDPEKVRLDDVLTQPYDKITTEMQERYYAASPYNLVRMELGKPEPSDNEKQNTYTRAAEFLQRSITDGVLVRDHEASVYAYSQTFAHPSGKPGSGGGEARMLERRGFIALGRLAEYSENIVFRHEQTLSKPKSDRLNLLRATRTHSGQIFMLYSDPEREMDAAIEGHIATQPPTSKLTDEYGVVHRMWKISDPALILTLRDKMSDKKLIIADGHHRYETALTYRAERRTHDFAKLMTSGRTGQLTVNPNAPYESTMMTFVNMDAEGLVVLPTHRVVFGLANFKPEGFLEGAGKFFEVERMESNEAAAALKALSAARHHTAFVAAIQDETYLLRAKDETTESRNLLDGFSEQQRRLDVLCLHKILLQHVLGISQAAITEQRHLSYVRSAEEAIARVRDGANVAFLMNPVTMKQLADIAFAGEVMPQKSTDFYPKLLSGLTLYAVD